VRSVTVGAACSRLGVAVPVGPADASEGEICAVKNCMAEGNCDGISLVLLIFEVLCMVVRTTAS
jgi:hypothetical protein